ncbi:general transcription factor IIF subunit 1 isoform X1 [Clarias magur]|uniref:Transcription initiation factor IIF subunit alpha n=1 Tax=Clarias magur TaxID=1594786 RepID=A0A8J4U033_CLAMG|nr:general transcription factor IIF subunit 1 isoform X1 [Clarias magur]
MERDLSNRRMYGEEETPEGAAGSEFGKKQREEARRKKFGIVTREFKVEDQPWILKVNGKAGRRFKGQKKGGVTENASYYIFTQCADGAFEAFPVHAWYNFTPVAKHRTLTAEEAEEEWGRRNKVVNHFSIMLQRRLKEQEHGEEDEEEGEKGAKKKKKKKKGGQGGDLRIHDLDDDLELSSDNSESSGGEDGEGRSKSKKEDNSKAKGKKKKKKKGSDAEGHEDSDDGDFEGLEVDYMSDESSSEDEEPEKVKPSKGEDVPKDSSGESDTSEDSDIEGETASALFMAVRPVQESERTGDLQIPHDSSVYLLQKKRTPPKRGGRGSAGSSRAGSRPGTPSIDHAATSNTLRAAATKLEQGKRQAACSSDTPAAKRLKMEPVSGSPSGKSTPQPASGKSTPSSRYVSHRLTHRLH